MKRTVEKYIDVYNYSITFKLPRQKVPPRSIELCNIQQQRRCVRVAY